MKKLTKRQIIALEAGARAMRATAHDLEQTAVTVTDPKVADMQFGAAKLYLLMSQDLLSILEA